EFLRLFHVGCDVVIHEEEQLLVLFLRLDLSDDVVDRPTGLTRTEHCLHSAKFALEMATAPRLHQANGQVALALKNSAIGLQSVQGRSARLAIKLFEPASAGIIRE